ncbi:TPA: hypothetical protein QDZ34_004346 [Stenotrophomonas maltophilia]|nr:hypothetical protein [Stenotrophomonas maltophilia]HDS0951755.1 hypothetical protein [Stenotrophomonas maltophilia]HDS1025441.1 hypothetical protein [Stenotrophomonas maltophilia]HDS1028178.1 hypothetical protein [Stenotrophomonas maltophilia]HDS1029691.1 hypothetical protein [Stenotrophomonas maltophilia]
MQLTEITGVKDWLSQFELPDVYLAEHMLKRIRYVNFEEFEAWLQKSVNDVLKEIERIDGRSAVAIFPVEKPSTHKFNEEKERKATNDSGGRIAHSLKNIERSMPNYVELTPRLESMRAQRVRNIVFVDDFIGTGDRFIKSWRKTVPGSVKSWCSLGWCKIWLLTFAAHKAGVSNIERNIRAISNSRVRTHVNIPRSFLVEQKNFRSIILKYSRDLGSARQRMGYGGLGTPIIFQHGCPNNVPLIFWKSSPKRSKRPWKALFPERSIPINLYPFFSTSFIGSSLPEELWLSKNYSLAVQMLENFTTYSDEQHQLLLALTWISKGLPIATIGANMLISDADLSEIFAKLRNGGAIDDSGIITRFGRDILLRMSRPSRNTSRAIEYSSYFPSSFLGFRRET